MRFRLLCAISAMLLPACAVTQPAPRADWANLHMGMSYAEVVRIVGPPQRKLQLGDRVEGAILPGPNWEVYIWQVGDVTKSASFSSDHLNGITNQFQ